MPLSYSRVLIKLSGESLAQAGQGGIDPDKALACARELAHARTLGVELAIVIGGGNLWRGTRGKGLELSRVSSDQIGMMATVMNALALKSALESCGVPSLHQTALPIPGISQGFDSDQAIEHLKKGSIVLFSAGTGHPFFSTDTASALRAAQVQAQAIFKVTQVDGIYERDPRVDPSAKRLPALSFQEALDRQLHIMDMTAFDICRQANIDICVFKNEPNNLYSVLQNPSLGSKVSRDSVL